MGTCSGKDSDEEIRRHLSWSSGGDGPPRLGAARSSTAAVGDGSDVLALLTSGRRPSSAPGRRFAVRGQPCDTPQKGFTDKAACVFQAAEAELRSRVGWACKKGLKPDSPNQDDFCIYGADDAGVYGVFDGHGLWGHDVSSFVQEALPRAVLEHPRFQEDPEEALSAAFEGVQARCVELQADGRLDCSLSGCTATVAVHRDGKLHIAHVGDSRAVLCRLRDGNMIFQDMTEDHKPNNEDEMRRVEASGGEVRRLDGEVPHRVFLRGKMYPGLAMTRAIGDTIGTSAGVSSTPTVRSFEVMDDWRFLLLCSDGVWEFLSSQQVVNIVQGCGADGAADAQKAADRIAAAAWERWIEEEANVVDDITVICAGFSHG